MWCVNQNQIFIKTSQQYGVLRDNLDRTISIQYGISLALSQID